MSTAGVARERQAARIRRTTTAGVIALAVAGFAMSYDALHALAAAQGVPGGLAWLWPLVVDGFIAVASLAVVHAVLDGRSTAYPWCLVLGFSMVSVGFNMLHAAPTAPARLVAAVPPLALVLSFELLMRQIRVAVRAPLFDDSALPDSVTAVVVPRQALAPKALPANKREPAAGSVPERARAFAEARTIAGLPVTGALLATELGVSDGYGRRLLRELTSTIPRGAAL